MEHVRRLRARLGAVQAELLGILEGAKSRDDLVYPRARIRAAQESLDEAEHWLQRVEGGARPSEAGLRG